MRKSIHQRIDIKFADNINKLYPEGSFRKKTEKLNKMLEELLYGNKKK